MITACATRSGPRNMVTRDLEGILNRLADLKHFLTLVDFFQKIAFFAIFLLSRPLQGTKQPEWPALICSRCIYSFTLTHMLIWGFEFLVSVNIEDQRHQMLNCIISPPFPGWLPMCCCTCGWFCSLFKKASISACSCFRRFTSIR